MVSKRSNQRTTILETPDDADRIMSDSLTSCEVSAGPGEGGRFQSLHGGDPGARLSEIQSIPGERPSLKQSLEFFRVQLEMIKLGKALQAKRRRRRDPGQACS
jgi:hypothetical protein